MTGEPPLEVLTSPAGALSLASAALLLVLGFRLAVPRSPLTWAATAAYAAALVATLLGALRLLPGPIVAPSLAARLAGIAAIVAGLLLAATARRRAEGAEGSRARPPVHLGLVLVLAGQLLRMPSAAGAIAVAVAALVNLVAARGAARAAAGA